MHGSPCHKKTLKIDLYELHRLQIVLCISEASGVLLDMWGVPGIKLSYIG